MPRRITKAVRKVKKFYGLGRYDVTAKKRPHRGGARGLAARRKRREVDVRARKTRTISGSEFQARLTRAQERGAKQDIRGRKKASSLRAAHMTRRGATGLVIAGAGGATYRSRSKRKKKRQR